MDVIRQAKIENVKMIDRLSNILTPNKQSIGPFGNLYITATHLIFVETEDRNETWILHSLLSSIEKQNVSSVGTPIQIKCKNFQSITFIIPKEKDAFEIVSSLNNLSAPSSIHELYCFNYSASNESFQSSSQLGWNKFDLKNEFRRQGVPNKQWSISNINQDYSLCDTYPRTLVVPSSLSKEMIIGSAKFRSKGRLPVLTYYYYKNGSTICRCSQPLAGFNARCEEDETLLQSILSTTNSTSSVLYVVDTRPKVRISFPTSLKSFLPDTSSPNPTTAASLIVKLTNFSLFSSSSLFYSSPSNPSPSSNLNTTNHNTANDISPANNNNDFNTNTTTDDDGIDADDERTLDQTSPASSVPPSPSTISSSSSPTTTIKSSCLSRKPRKRKRTHHHGKKINAMANRAAGKGYENETFYENIKVHSFNIENIHVMRSSLSKLLEAAELKVLSVDAYLSAIESSGWLKHIKLILETASFVSRSVMDGIPVVVHCSDGWDRTAQACSIACLLLDPYYRTFDGFQALIEKDWLSFGHKFSERCGHINPNSTSSIPNSTESSTASNQSSGKDSKETSPIFTQFIDCIWQIMQQFPFDFEFNELLLLTLHDHVYSCQFGTFIGNSEKERQTLNLKSTTYSLWALLDSKKDSYVNPLYYIKRSSKLGGSDKIQDGPLMVDLTPGLITFWRRFYNRFDAGVHPRESIDDLFLVTYNHVNSLQQHILFLEARIAEQKELLTPLPPLVPEQTNVQPSSTKSDASSSLKVVDPLSAFQTLSKSTSSRDDSFDSIDMPLKTVKECMKRLEMQHHQHELEEASEQQASLVQDNLRKNLRLDQLKPVYDEPIYKIMIPKKQAINYDQIRKDMMTVTLDWDPWRSCASCSCGTRFEITSTRCHCHCCGKIFCVRCTDRLILLPGHRIKVTNPQTGSKSDSAATNVCNKTSSNNTEGSSEGDVFESTESESSKVMGKGSKVNVCKSCHKIVLEMEC